MIYEKPGHFAGSIVTLIEALLIALVASGMLVMPEKTIQLWVNVAIAVVAVISPIIGFWWTSKHTTANVRPMDTDGTPLRRSDGGIPLAQVMFEKKRS